MTRRVVIDASVAVKWFVPEERTDEADALSNSGLELIAPDLLGVEVANALRKKVTAGFIRTDDALDYLESLPRFLNEQIDHRTVLMDAMRMGASIGHPVYDCVYLVLARQQDAILVTDDFAFLKRTAQHKIGGAVSLASWEAAIR